MQLQRTLINNLEKKFFFKFSSLTSFSQEKFNSAHTNLWSVHMFRTKPVPFNNKTKSVFIQPPRHKQL